MGISATSVPILKLFSQFRDEAFLDCSAQTRRVNGRIFVERAANAIRQHTPAVYTTRETGG